MYQAYSEGSPQMAGTEYDGNLESEWRVLDLADVREGWEAGA